MQNLQQIIMRVVDIADVGSNNNHLPGESWDDNQWVSELKTRIKQDQQFNVAGFVSTYIQLTTNLTNFLHFATA